MGNNATKFNLTDYLLATLAVQAHQIADAGHNGWGGCEWPVVRYLETVEGIDTPVERAFANKGTIHVNTMPAHWPAIPQAVLVRAAVQCGRLREVGR